jgi:lysozyme
MKTSDRGAVALALHEGIVPAPYLDSVNVWTFGIGHAETSGLPPVPSKMPRGMPADLDAALRQAFDVFRADLPKYEDAVRKAVKVSLAQHEFDALVSFHYNTGGIARAALTRHLNAGNRKAAADAFMGWSKPAEIIPRRKAEQRLFHTGTYPTGNIPVWGVTAANRPDWRRPVRSLTPDQALALMKASFPKPAPSERQGLIAWLVETLLGLFRRG